MKLWNIQKQAVSSTVEASSYHVPCSWRSNHQGAEMMTLLISTIATFASAQVSSSFSHASMCTNSLFSCSQSAHLDLRYDEHEFLWQLLALICLSWFHCRLLFRISSRSSSSSMSFPFTWGQVFIQLGDLFWGHCFGLRILPCLSRSWRQLRFSFTCQIW